MTETEQKWAERVRAWRESGLTAKDFADGKEFSDGGLRHWAYRLKRRSAGAEQRAPSPAASSKKSAAPVRVARVERVATSAPPAAPARAIVVEIGAAKLHVPARADEATLRMTMTALIEASARAGAR